MAAAEELYCDHLDETEDEELRTHSGVEKHAQEDQGVERTDKVEEFCVFVRVFTQVKAVELPEAIDPIPLLVSGNRVALFH